jgi:hypothetical protein
MYVMSYEEDTCMVCATVWCVFRGRTDWRLKRFWGIRCQMTPPTSSSSRRDSRDPERSKGHRKNAMLQDGGRCFEIQ